MYGATLRKREWNVIPTREPGNPANVLPGRRNSASYGVDPDYNSGRIPEAVESGVFLPAE